MTRFPTMFILNSVAVLCFLYLPVAVLIVLSFNDSQMGVTWQGFSLRWYDKLFHNPAFLDAMINSLIIALASTGMSLLLGVGTAIGMERLRGRAVSFINMGLVLPLVIPEILLGVALLMMFVLIRMPLGFLTIMLGHGVFSLPLTIVIIRARLRKLDPTWEDAARDLGADSWRVLTHVTLPLLKPAIVGAALLAFTVSLDDFVVTFFVAGPGSTTLPLKVFSMIKTGMTPEINALSALLVLVSILGVGCSWCYQQRVGRYAEKRLL
ncbi:MAG: ABC transporter permease [Nitrospirales bacterium]|nr:ABC transporter permease [Nitrospirales bacterium]